MTRRGRAAAFLLLAAGLAATAAVMAQGYAERVERQLGELVPAVVAVTDLPARQTIGPRAARRLLEVRRVPARFVPPGALREPAAAVGRATAAPVPAGSYLLGGQLVLPGAATRRRPRAGRGRQPIEIGVTGAGALGRAPAGSRVDVVVTNQPRGEHPGRTFVVAARVELLELRPDTGADPGGPTAGGAGLWTATLAVTRRQALRLIAAEGMAREIRLLARP